MKKTISQLAKKVGLLLLKEFQQAGRVTYRDKYRHEIITRFDLLSERIILKELKRKYPKYAILSEESGRGKIKSDYVWVVDPIDGTTNFAMKNPLFSISIGLVYRGEPIFGVVYAPITDEMFVAEKDKGATLNNRKVRVNKNKQMSKAFLTFCHGSNAKAIIRAIQLYGTMKLKGKDFRQLGSAALECSFVACGRTDAIMIPGVHPWDVAAGVVIVREAGGRVTDFKGREWNIRSKDILATNGYIHQQLLKHIDV
ncbi:inositol monophosphatase [Patescibacteria group bacterium]|nr:inositol monophosphatase [Patescibacteria group bacterium]MBU1890050.1 inositol monophosphatase [Patescibacteria group bacterium]